MLEQLGTAPRTATELASLGHALSFHQVRRRIDLYLIGAMICEVQNGSRHRRYELTSDARKAMGLVTGLGRWRERHAKPAGTPGLTRPETARLLRTTLPLVVLSKHYGKQFNLVIGSRAQSDTDGLEVVRAMVSTEGRIVDGGNRAATVATWGRGEVGDWIEVLLQGTEGRIRASEDDPLIEAVLQGMHKALWEQSKSTVA